MLYNRITYPAPPWYVIQPYNIPCTPVQQMLYAVLTESPCSLAVRAYPHAPAPLARSWVLLTSETAAGTWHAWAERGLRQLIGSASGMRRPWSAFPEEPNRARSRNARRAIPRSWLCASTTRCERDRRSGSVARPGSRAGWSARGRRAAAPSHEYGACGRHRRQARCCAIDSALPRRRTDGRAGGNRNCHTGLYRRPARNPARLQRAVYRRGRVRSQPVRLAAPPYLLQAARPAPARLA